MSETPQITLSVISMWQPWASWVAWGWKTVETRTHTRFASLVGKRIGIHAAQTFDVRARLLAGRYLSDGRFRVASRGTDNYPRGLLCTAFVARHRRLSIEDAEDALIECATERFGLFLSDVHRIEPPLRIKGRQGIWREICPASVHGSHVNGVSSPNLGL